MSTPRTDAEHARLVLISEGPHWIKGKDYCDMLDFARDLERENARLRAALQLIADIKVPRGLKPFEFARAALKGE